MAALHGFAITIAIVWGKQRRVHISTYLGRASVACKCLWMWFETSAPKAYASTSGHDSVEIGHEMLNVFTWIYKVMQLVVGKA